MKPKDRRLRRAAVAAGIMVCLLAGRVLWPARSGRLEAAPLDRLRAWWDGLGCPRPCDPGRPDAGVDGDWYWLRSPEQERRTVVSLYNRYCIRCHGVDGRGVWDVPDVPDFTNGRWQAVHSDGQRTRSILEGRGAVMPPFRGTLTLEEASAVGRYLRTFVPGTETPRPGVGTPETPAAPDKPPAKPGQ